MQVRKISVQNAEKMVNRRYARRDLANAHLSCVDAQGYRLLRGVLLSLTSAVPM